MPAITKKIDRWFDYPNDPLKGRVLIHHLTPGEVKTITKETFKQDVSYNDVKGDMVPSYKVNHDQDKDIEMTISASLIGWENFFKEDGKTPIKFSSKNIQLCVDTIDGFVTFISDCRKKISDDIAKEKKAQSKNSKGSAQK